MSIKKSHFTVFSLNNWSRICFCSPGMRTNILQYMERFSSLNTRK